jgi:short-subunit dehydrogenase
MDVRRTALITGASSGIGEAFAEVFAAEGFDLVITARRDARLRAIAERIADVHRVHVHPMMFDLAERDSPSRLCEEIERRRLTIDALVNNAGFGTPGAFVRGRWATHEAMLQVIVATTCELTYRLLPGMISREYGRIINVASTAGLARTPAGVLYGAAKTFVVSFSELLAREVRTHGVHVTAICPGLTRSEFHASSENAESVRRLPSWLWMDASTVARQGFDASSAGATVYVNGRINRLTVALFKHVPMPLVVAAGRRFAKAYGLRRQPPESTTVRQ